MTEVLSERELQGWPGITVRIESCTNFTEFRAIVHDIDGDHEIYTGKDRSRARDAYFHPFVFGYDTPSVVPV